MNVAVVVAVVVLIAVVAIVAWLYSSRRRRAEALREQFGPEYDHAVETYGERSKAEKALEARTERVAALHIHALAPADSQKYAEQWRSVQSRFVDDPEHTIGEADRLCGQAMQDRGYPMGD